MRYAGGWAYSYLIDGAIHVQRVESRVERGALDQCPIHAPLNGVVCIGHHHLEDRGRSVGSRDRLLLPVCAQHMAGASGDDGDQ